MPSLADAHPHAFIDLRTTLELNGHGDLVAIQEHWVFDQYYTEFALHDFGYKPGGALDHDKIMELARENLKGLKDFDYFTHVSDKVAKIQTATTVNSYLESNRVAMDFTVPLSNPVTAPFTIKIYDPSYYTAMLHQANGLHYQGALPKTCTGQIIKANPNIVWTNLAVALDKNAAAPDDLGKYFAETVSITCK